MSFWKGILFWTIVLVIGFIIFYTSIPVEITQFVKNTYGKIEYNQIMESDVTCGTINIISYSDRGVREELKEMICEITCNDENYSYKAYECQESKLMCYCKDETKTS